MNKSLITTRWARQLTFAAGETPEADVLTEGDLLAAVERYLKPVIGPRLIDALAEGRYGELLEGYVALPLALFARVVAQPRLDARTLRVGTAVPCGEGVEGADAGARRALRRALTEEARTLLGYLSDHLEERASMYPEYDAGQNILKRCRIHGNIIQNR